MNIEPCVRLGIRISPKIRENPADNRNRRPPNVTLLTVSSSQNVIHAALRYPAAISFRSPDCSPGFASLNPGYVISALGQRRIIARIDRMREEVLLRPGPELTHVLVSFDGLVPEFEAVFGTL